MISKYGSNPQSSSFASRHEEIEYFNAFADYWRYDIGINVIPAQTKLKTTSIKWSQYQNAPIPESQHIEWKNSGAFIEGVAIIAGKVWHRSDRASQYFTLIDLDKREAIQEFCTRNDKQVPLEKIAEKFIVEQHLDDKNRAHVYFYSPIPFVKKNADSKTGLEVKGLGEHGISICTPSVHKNKDQNDRKEYRYEMIKLILPVFLERNQALDMMYHLDSICLKNRVQYLHKDHESNKLNRIIKSLQIDSTVEIDEGERHRTLLSAADSLLIRYGNRGKTEESMKKFLSDLNQQLCQPEPLPDDELNQIWNSALEYVNRIKNDRAEATEEDDDNLIESTSEQIKNKYRFVALPSKELLYYNNGVYTTGGEIIIEKEAEAMCGYSLSNKALTEIKGHITRNCYHDKDDFDKDLNIINMKNGLYNILTAEFTEHNPDYLSLIQIPINYDPTAKPKLFGKFLSEVIYPTEIRTAVETMAYTFLRNNPYEIINILFGYGGNGKSVFTGVLTSMHGAQNVSSVPLRDMIKDPFALSDLEGKSINIDTELSSKSIEDTAVIKKLTGRQAVRIQRKNQRAYDTKLHAKLFFSANNLPMTHDTSDAFFRRCCMLSFPNNFEGKDDPDLLNKLTTDEELSGIFNVFMIALRRILKTRGIFVNERTIHGRREKYELVLNPIGAFIDLAVAKDSTESDRVTKDDFYMTYTRFCKEKRLAIESKESFGKILKKQFYYQDGREASGARRTIWKGARLTGIYNLEDDQQMLAV